MFSLLSNTKELGDKAEKLALDYLLDKGLKLVEKNYRIKGGEIDLIMKDDQYLVFTEVRYRKNKRYGSGAESVDFKKQARLIKAASSYLQEFAKLAHQPARFDVISITASDGEFDIEWIQNAFQA